MRFVRWLGGFFEAHALQSMCRLVAFGCGVSAWIVAVKNPDAWKMVSALIGGGAVALLTRNKPTRGQDGPISPTSRSES